MSSSSNYYSSRRDKEDHRMDPVYYNLANINGHVNRMNKKQLQEALLSNCLNQNGVKEVLQKRLKHFYRKKKLQSVDKFTDKQFYKYFIVIDFEATCEEKNPPEYLHEIIEFPAVLIDAGSLQVVDQFHKYCKPQLNPNLSTFCTKLTGITQSQINNAATFPEVFQLFNTWLKDKGLLDKRKCCFITDGSWDFSKFLNVQCCLSDIQYPSWAKKWLNIKKIYGNFYKLNKPKLNEMLSNLGMTFEGRQHCGLDDALNIAKVALKLLEDGCVLLVNERMSCGKLCSITDKEKQKMKTDFALNSSPPNFKTANSLNIDEPGDDFIELTEKLKL